MGTFKRAPDKYVKSKACSLQIHYGGNRSERMILVWAHVWMFRIAIILCSNSSLLECSPPIAEAGFDSRPRHVSLETSSLGWRWPWSSLSILTINNMWRWYFAAHLSCHDILWTDKWTRYFQWVLQNRVGIGLSYRPARLHRLAELIP